MKVLVPVKRVVDYNVKVRVKSDCTRRRHRQRQDEHESVRRDRRRGGRAAQGKGRRDRGDCRVVRRPAMPGDAAHGDGDRRRPGDPRPVRRRAAAARGGQAAEGAGRQGAARSGHSRQAGDRRRLQPDGPDARRAVRPAAGDVRVEGRGGRRLRQRDTRGGRRLEVLKVKLPGHRHDRPASQRAALRDAAQHHESEEEADGRAQARGPRGRRRSRT